MKRKKTKTGTSGKSGRAESALNAFLLLQLIFMVILSLGITQLISTSTTKSSDDYMKTIADERSRIITGYVKNAEQILADYSHSGEIKKAVLNPSDKSAAEAAQKYTDEFSADIPNLKGIYLSQWDSGIIVHKDASLAGSPALGSEELKTVQEELKKYGNSVYDAGISASEGTDGQTALMYRAFYGDDGKPAGFAGLEIYTGGLADILSSLNSHDMKNAFYTMVDTSDRKYVFHKDESMVGTEAELPEILNLCEKLPADGRDVTGKFSYSDNGVKYVSVYSYSAETGWIFMIDDAESEVYRLTQSMRGYMILFCIFCFVLIVLFNIINKKRRDATESLDSVVEKHERTRESLENAVYNDFLTDIGNRVSFSSDFEAGKIELPENQAYYFALFNIREFSKVNIVFGEEAGDMILVSSARYLNKHFPDARIYRTGSDEFLVAQVLSKDSAGHSSFMKSISETLRDFSKPFDVTTAKVNVEFSVAVASRSRNVNISVLPALKNMMAINPQGSVSVTDLDLMNANMK